MDEKAFSRQIEEVIESRINPLLKAHGGSVSLKSFTHGNVVLRMEGQCAYCPSSIGTLNDVIKPIIKRYLPTVRDVTLDDSTDEDMVDFARKILGL